MECIVVFWVGELDSGGRALHKLNLPPEAPEDKGAKTQFPLDQLLFPRRQGGKYIYVSMHVDMHIYIYMKSTGGQGHCAVAEVVPPAEAGCTESGEQAGV